MLHDFEIVLCKLIQIRTSKFRKVVQQHTESMVELLDGFCWKFSSFQQWRNFENPLKIDKLIVMTLVYYFSWDTVWLQ